MWNILLAHELKRESIHQLNIISGRQPLILAQHLKLLPASGSAFCFQKMGHAIKYRFRLRQLFLYAAVGALLILLTRCGPFPRDPEDSLHQITNGKLSVGYTVHRPFVFTENGVVSGLEAELVEGFAAEMGATVQWEEAPEAVLAEKLKKQQLDIAIGGFTTESHYKKELGFTRPYMQTDKKYVFAVAPGENALLLRLEKFLQQKKQSIDGQ